MTAELELQVRRELRTMAERMDDTGDTWPVIRGRVARRARIRRTVRTAAAAVTLVALAATGWALSPRDDTAGLATDSGWSVEDLRVRDRSSIGGSQLPQSVTRSRTPLASDGGAVWFSRLGASEIGRFDPVSATVTSTVDTGMPIHGIAVAPDSIWGVADGYADASRVDARTGSVRRVPLEADGSRWPSTGGIGFGDRAMWVPVAPSGLLRIDLETEAVEWIDLGVRLQFVSVAAGSLWGIGDAGTVVRLDLRDRQITARLELGVGDYRIEHGDGDGAVWVLDIAKGDLLRITPDLGSVDRFAVGPGTTNLTVSAGAVWVTATVGGEVIVVDQESGQIRARLEIGGRPGDITTAVGEIWVNDPDAGTLVSVVLR